MKRNTLLQMIFVLMTCGIHCISSPFASPIQAQDVKPKPDQESVKPGINAEFLSRELDVDQFLKRFEVESREVFSSRQALTQLLELQPGMSIADIGSGTGAYLNLFAEGVGTQGKVYAVDLAPNFLAHLRDRVQKAGWMQVEVVECDEKQVGLGADLLDRAYICDTYHHFEYPLSTMTSLYKAMKKGSMLVIVDFEREPGTSREWVLNHVRAGREVVRTEIEAVGFEFIDNPKLESLHENYVMRFRK